MDVADLLAQIMRAGMAMTSGRAAVVVGSLLNKAQAERTLVHPRVRVYATLEGATNWLRYNEDEVDPVASPPSSLSSFRSLHSIGDS